jgi:hypothetical protein
MRLSRKCIPVVERVCFIDFFNYTYSESLEYLVGTRRHKKSKTFEERQLMRFFTF